MRGPGPFNGLGAWVNMWGPSAGEPGLKLGFDTPVPSVLAEEKKKLARPETEVS